MKVHVGILHRVRFGFGLQHPHLRLRFRLLHGASFLRFRFQLRNLHFLEFNVLLGSEAFVFLLFQQQPFEALGILLGQLQIAQQDLAHHDAVAGQSRSDRFRGFRTQLFPLGREYFPGHVIGSQLPVDRRHHRRDHLFANRLRQVRVNRIKTPRIEPVAHRDGQPNIQPLARLNGRALRLFSCRSPQPPSNTPVRACHTAPRYRSVV